MAEEERPGATVAHDKGSEVFAMRDNGIHRDVKEFAWRLVRVLEAQQRRDLGGAQLQSQPPRSLIDVCERRTLRWKAEVGGGDGDEIDVGSDLADRDG
jgi:hypothetical protein